MGKTITYNGDNGLEIMQDLSIEISAIFDSFNDFDKFLGTPYECELFDNWWSEDKWNMHLQKLVYYKQFIPEILVKSIFNSKEHFSTFIDINIEKLTSIKNTKLKSVPDDRKIIIYVYDAANVCLSKLLTSIGQTETNIEDSNITRKDIENNSTDSTAKIIESKKLIWNGNAASLAFFIDLLIVKGYINPMSSNTELADTLKNSFDFNNKAIKGNSLRNLVKRPRKKEELTTEVRYINPTLIEKIFLSIPENRDL